MVKIQILLALNLSSYNFIQELYDIHVITPVYNIF